MQAQLKAQQLGELRARVEGGREQRKEESVDPCCGTGAGTCADLVRLHQLAEHAVGVQREVADQGAYATQQCGGGGGGSSGVARVW